MSDGNLNDSEGIKDLRKKFEDQANQLKALLEENSKLKADSRKSTVAELLKAKGVDAKFAKLYNSEDASEDAVNQWAEEFFGVTTAGSEENNEELDNIRAIQEATSGGTARTASRSENGAILGDPDALQKLMENAGSYEDLVKQLNFPKI